MCIFVLQLHRKSIPLGHLSSPHSHHLYYSFVPLLSFCSLLIKLFACCDSPSHSTPHLTSISCLLCYSCTFSLFISLSVSECYSYRFGVQCSLSRAIKALERSDEMPLSILRESSCFCTASQNAQTENSSSLERRRK